MKKYRNRFEILAQMLRIPLEDGGPVLKTRLMYGTYLSFGQTYEYLSFALRGGLLQKDEETRMYSLTKKGLEFIHKLDEMLSYVEGVPPL